MKKILLLLSFFAFITIAQAQIFKKELKKHDSQPGYFWFRPVIDVDTMELDDGGKYVNTKFLVEGFLTDGSPIEVFVEGKTLMYLLRLPAKGIIGSNVNFAGYMFTVESLGKHSFQKKKFIEESSDYYDKQKERLIRERNTEKYELWSEAPTKVNGKLEKGRFIPDQTNTTSGGRQRTPGTP